MDKPASVIRKELISDLTALIRESHLPPYVISPILADLKRELDAATEIQYKNEYNAYTQALNNAGVNATD